ncbi:tyrosine-type recombinase/integrase [Pseudomonas sp. NPDC078700]|uniref:tyrosine-type recombinase/integrase n=1 Tax=Pseudomonas sp. NPDC078700 TaxID=3364424 RepID=UPI0037CA8653
MRPRKKDRHLPARMYQRGPSYYYVEAGKWENLGKDYVQALMLYAKRNSNSSKNAMTDLIDRVMEHITPRRAKNTIEQYSMVAERMKVYLAEFEPSQVLPRHIAQIKMHLADTPAMANRTLSFLRVAFGYALEWGDVDSNPCVGIKPHAENKRDRYITDQEFHAILAQCSEYMKCVFELTYLTGQRISDVLAIRLSDVSEEGIQFQQKKTGSKVLVSMSPDLRAIIARCKALPRPVRGMNLICNKKGLQVDYSTVKVTWAAARKAAKVDDVKIHDLRAKALTDTKRQGNNAQKLGGHSSERMTARYLRNREHDVAHPPQMPKETG